MPECEDCHFQTRESGDGQSLMPHDCLRRQAFQAAQARKYHEAKDCGHPTCPYPRCIEEVPRGT